MLAISRIEAKSIRLKCRQAIALPLYAIALLLDFLSDALGRLGAWIAGDDWP
jgi:hypothetical protein